jgi:hypothetical protein
MQCMACGAEMILMKVVPDDTMPIPGFEHHNFMCSGCLDVERRLVFTTHGREIGSELLPVHAAPPIGPAALDERAVPSSLLTRVLATIRNHYESMVLPAMCFPKS